MKLIPPIELAPQIGVTTGCLAKWRLEGEGPAFHKIGNRVMYAERDVSDWLQKRRVRSTSEKVD